MIMKDIINNLINFYEMQAETLNILLANTQKALEQSEKERRAGEQIQRVEGFVKGLTMNLNNMLTRFYFFKDRKNRKQEQMTDEQTKVITEFAVFVKTLTKNLCSLLKRFQENQNFEEKIDKEIRELETSISQRLKEFDKALEETNGSLTTRLTEFAREITGRLVKVLRGRNLVLTAADGRKTDKLLKKPTKSIKEDSQARVQDTGDSYLESVFNCSSIKSVKNNDGKKSKCLMDLKA
jgi:hypothetical protein